MRDAASEVSCNISQIGEGWGDLYVLRTKKRRRPTKKLKSDDGDDRHEKTQVQLTHDIAEVDDRLKPEIRVVKPTYRQIGRRPPRGVQIIEVTGKYEWRRREDQNGRMRHQGQH